MMLFVRNNINCFYLSQTYTKTPKLLIRDNANMIIIFKQDEMNIKHIYNGHVIGDITFKQFVDPCSKCCKDIYRFLVVSKDDLINKGRYRKGFDSFVQLLYVIW